MRKLANPRRYCSVGHRGLSDGLFWTNKPSNPFSGPFDSEVDLNNAIVAKYVDGGLSKDKADYYSRTFKEIFQVHVSIFSHGDFERKNVLLRGSTAAGEYEPGRNIANLQVVIID